jgi:hypothetical protein
MMVLKSMPMPSDSGDKESALFFERAEWDLVDECRELGYGEWLFSMPKR